MKLGAGSQRLLARGHPGSTFSGDTGVFEGEDIFKGRPVLVRYLWSGVTTSTPRWEQAFSDDGGKTWETNWVMDFTPEGREG